MPELKGTQTEKNLQAAFAGESQANRKSTNPLMLKYGSNCYTVAM